MKKTNYLSDQNLLPASSLYQRPEYNPVSPWPKPCQDFKWSMATNSFKTSSSYKDYPVRFKFYMNLSYCWSRDSFIQVNVSSIIKMCYLHSRISNSYTSFSQVNNFITAYNWYNKTFAHNFNLNKPVWIVHQFKRSQTLVWQNWNKQNDED